MLICGGLPRANAGYREIMQMLESYANNNASDLLKKVLAGEADGIMRAPDHPTRQNWRQVAEQEVMAGLAGFFAPRAGLAAGPKLPPNGGPGF